MAAGHRRLVVVTASAALTLLAAACGGSPTATVGPTTAATGASDASAAGTGGAAVAETDPFAEVVAEVEGLDGDARRERLAELAAEEGSATLYTSNTDAADFAEAFGDEFGVEVEVYRAQANTVLQRLVQEAEAGFAGADLVDTNMEELISLDQGEGLLVPYEGPAREGLPEAALFPGWTANRFNVFVTPQNTDLVPEDERPAEYPDLTDPAYEGVLLMEPRAYEWYMTLSTTLADGGMSQEDLDAMWEGMAANATLVEGHTAHAEFLAAGEFGISAGTYNHLIDDRIQDGAPLTWQPALAPTVLRPNGAGLLRTADNPATALLFFEWLASDGQQLIADANRVPAREEFQGGILEGVETVGVDGDLILEEGAEWEARYEELLQASDVGPESGG